MFCCTNSKEHEGEIITSICNEEQCIRSQNQLCCAQCIIQYHSGHSIITMKKMLPDLLAAHNEKNMYLQIIRSLIVFVKEQLDQDESIKINFGGVDALSVLNVVDAVKIAINNMMKKSQQQNKKIKQIQKTLKLKSTPAKSQIVQQTTSKVNPLLANSHVPGEYKNLNMMPMVNSHLQAASICTFSHTHKHPYITISADSHSAFKNSHAGGYKLAILSANPFPLTEHADISNIEARLKIIKSHGNIMIGLGIPDKIKSKQYINCYGSNQGAYLLGQNNNDKLSAITFHNTDSVYNRKQLVGWNYVQGDIIGLSISKQEGAYFLNFKKYTAKQNGKIDYNKILSQFMMPFTKIQDASQNYHLLVLLNSVGDEVLLIGQEE